MPPNTKQRRRPPSSSSVLKLSEVKREVYELGASGFSKRAKRVFDDEKLAAFGGKVKNPKMPFKMLLGIRRAEKERAKRAQDEARAAGIVTVTAPKLDSTLRARGKKRRPKRGGGPLDDSAKDGILRIHTTTKR